MLDMNVRLRRGDLSELANGSMPQHHVVGVTHCRSHDSGKAEFVTRKAAILREPWKDSFGFNELQQRVNCDGLACKLQMTCSGR